MRCDIIARYFSISLPGGVAGRNIRDGINFQS
jgi:hypothetical protein